MDIHDSWNRYAGRTTAFLCIIGLCVSQAFGAEQSRESMANDQTANQWTFMGAYQWMDYHQDEIASGITRPEGVDSYFQLRAILPLQKNKVLPFMTLSRLTMRYARAQDGTTGRGNSDFFLVGQAYEWETGRFGIGPMFTIPAASPELGSTDWTWGLTLGYAQRFFSDRLNLFLITSQGWGGSDPSRPEDEDLETPLVINPVALYQFSDTWYLGNGDMVIRYNWQERAWIVPLGLRIGKLFVREKDAFNVYLEYQTSVIYKDWPGSAPSNTLRVNVGYTIPVNF